MSFIVNKGNCSEATIPRGFSKENPEFSKQKSICEANFAWIFARYWNGVNSNVLADGKRKKRLSIDIKNRFTYNNIKRKACFSSGLTLKSDMLVNHVIDRWRTTLKSDIFTSTQLVVGRQH